MTAGYTRRGFDLDLEQFAAEEAALAFKLLSSGVRFIEHKRDCIATRTGNLFVEYSQPSGPSGIATTTSDSWAFEYDEQRWIIVPTHILRTAARLAYLGGKRVPGGDGNNFDGVLVPVRWLVPPYPQALRGQS